MNDVYLKQEEPYYNENYIDKPMEVIVERAVPIERIVEVPFDVYVERPVERRIERPVIIEKMIDKPVERIIEQEVE